MTKQSSPMLLLLLLLVSCTSHGALGLAVPLDGAGASDFDFYILATFWPPELCHSEHTASCSSPQEWWLHHFTGHGLWPNNNNGTYPQFCGGAAFDQRVTDEQIGLDVMEVYWPNFNNDPGNQKYDNLWQHEWEKHGTCTGLEQSAYFTTALEMFKGATPAAVSGAVGTTMGLADLETAYGGHNWVVLQCKSGKYLDAAFLCYSRGSGAAAMLPSKRIECPPAVMNEATCTSDTIMIPQFGAHD